ncbi:MAG: recombination mediator RecR [Leptospirales bacterium]
MNKLLERLSNTIATFPGVGKKSAHRISFFLLKQPENYIENLVESINSFYHETEFCPKCSIPRSRESDCEYCSGAREQSTLCIVEQPSDALVIEASGDYTGLYHVLMGCLSPLEGIGPDEIRIKELLDRVSTNAEVKEIIVATNPSIEGNATANFIAEHFSSNKNIKVTRIASGLALGSQIEYADSKTVSQSIHARTLIEL